MSRRDHLRWIRYLPCFVMVGDPLNIRHYGIGPSFLLPLILRSDVVSTATLSHLSVIFSLVNKRVRKPLDDIVTTFRFM